MFMKLMESSWKVYFPFWIVLVRPYKNPCVVAYVSRSVSDSRLNLATDPIPSYRPRSPLPLLATTTRSSQYLLHNITNVWLPLRCMVELQIAGAQDERLVQVGEVEAQRRSLLRKKGCVLQRHV